MKNKLISLLAVACFALVGTVSLHAQAMAKVAGKAIDQQGQPITGAQVQMVSEDTGQKMTTKTDKNGNFFQIGVNPGKYKMTLMKDGQQLYFFDHVPVHLNPDDSPTEVDFDLKKEAEGKGNGTNNAAAAAALQQRQAEQQRQQKIASLQALVTQSATQEQAGQWDQAIQTLAQATTQAPTIPFLWARLGVAEYGAGDAMQKSGDKAGAAGHYQKSVEDYTKALDLKPTDPKDLSTIHNNLGQAYIKSGKPDEAVKEYTLAAQASPANAALSYFNLGAILTNQATVETNPQTKTKDIDAANEAFDKAIQADPNYADAWYQKGINLLSKATYDKSGNIVPAPGTAEAFQKYLQVAPTGAHAEEAKSMITSLGQKVETSYKKPKSK